MSGFWPIKKPVPWREDCCPTLSSQFLPLVFIALFSQVITQLPL